MIPAILTDLCSFDFAKLDLCCTVQYYDYFISSFIHITDCHFATGCTKASNSKANVTDLLQSNLSPSVFLGIFHILCCHVIIYCSEASVWVSSTVTCQVTAHQCNTPAWRYLTASIQVFLIWTPRFRSFCNISVWEQLFCFGGVCSCCMTDFALTLTLSLLEFSGISLNLFNLLPLTIVAVLGH